MRRRPIGVTLLGGLDLLGAATYAFFCMFSLVNQRAFRSMFERLDAGPVDPAIFLRLGPLLPVYFLIMIAVAAALGVGMWRLKNWARIVTLVLVGLCLAAGPMSLLLISSHPAGLVMTAARRGVAPFVRVVSFFLVGVPWEVSLTVSAFVCWYLLRPAVKAAFQQGHLPAAPA